MADDGLPGESGAYKRLTPEDVPAWERPAVGPRPHAPAPGPLPEPPAPAPKPSPSPPSPPRRRVRRWLVALGLALGVSALAAGGAAGFLAYRLLLGHDDRVTAGYAPADSWAYVAVNSDPTSQAWLDAWTIARNAGIDDELADLPRRWASDAGDDPNLWDNVLRPAIGEEVGVAVWPDTQALAGADPRAAAIVMLGDTGKAREMIAAALDDPAPRQVTHRDVTFQVNADGQAAGIVDDAVVLATSAAAFEDVIDARRDGGLDDVAGFQTAAGRAAGDPLLFVYLDTPALAENLRAAADERLPGDMALPAESIGELTDLGALTITLRAEDAALRISALSAGRPASYPMSAAADSDAFSAEMPGNSLLFLASADLYASVWQPMMTQLETADQAAGANGSFSMLPASGLGMLLGIDLEHDLLAHLRGQYAAAIDIRHSGTTWNGAFQFHSELDDPAAVRETLDTIAATLGATLPLEYTDGGFSVDQGRYSVDVGVVDDRLRVVGRYGAASGDGGSLHDDPGFRRAMELLPDDSSATGYIAVRPLLELVPDDAWQRIDPDTRAALETVAALAFSSGPAGDGTRTDLLLLFGE